MPPPPLEYQGRSAIYEYLNWGLVTFPWVR
jgi:hypothetical protein